MHSCAGGSRTTLIICRIYLVPPMAPCLTSSEQPKLHPRPTQRRTVNKLLDKSPTIRSRSPTKSFPDRLCTTNYFPNSYFSTNYFSTKVPTSTNIPETTRESYIKQQATAMRESADYCSTKALMLTPLIRTMRPPYLQQQGTAMKESADNCSTKALEKPPIIRTMRERLKN